MKFYLRICGAVFCGLILSASVYAREPQGMFDYCDRPVQPFDQDFEQIFVCYTVQKGDTLWSIAKKFYREPKEWNYIQKFLGGYERGEAGHPRRLFVGSRLALNVTLFRPYRAYAFVENGYVIDPLTNKLITVSRQYDGKGIIVKGDELYDGPFEYIRHLRISADGKNLSYEVDAGPDPLCKKTVHSFQIAVNKIINTHHGCGWDHKLMAYSPSGSHYAVRNNKEQDASSDQFLVLSDLGNGPYFDFVDSLGWADDATFYYRARSGSRWLVVVNHKEIASGEYLTDLKMKDSSLVFQMRGLGNSWKEQKITLDRP